MLSVVSQCMYHNIYIHTRSSKLRGINLTSAGVFLVSVTGCLETSRDQDTKCPIVEGTVVKTQIFENLYLLKAMSY